MNEWKRAAKLCERMGVGQRKVPQRNKRGARASAVGFWHVRYLLDIGASHDLGTKVEVLSLGLFEISLDFREGVLQIRLVCVEHHGLGRG